MGKKEVNTFLIYRFMCGRWARTARCQLLPIGTIHRLQGGEHFLGVSTMCGLQGVQPDTSPSHCTGWETRRPKVPYPFHELVWSNTGCDGGY